MDIRIKESLIIKCGGMEYSVRSGTLGVERDKIVFFYDTTKTQAVGFPRELCVENPMFKVSRTLSDRELSLKDVLSVIEKVKDPIIRNELTEIIKAL